jgi:hypothetical protein
LVEPPIEAGLAKVGEHTLTAGDVFGEIAVKLLTAGRV